MTRRSATAGTMCCIGAILLTCGAAVAGDAAAPILLALGALAPVIWAVHPDSPTRLAVRPPSLVRGSGPRVSPPIARQAVATPRTLVPARRLGSVGDGALPAPALPASRATQVVEPFPVFVPSRRAPDEPSSRFTRGS